jgi:molecular chaperone DnaK
VILCHAAISMDPVIGIDLGTTNSVVATVEDGVPVVITSRAGYKLTPSVVAFSKSGKRLVGHLAKRQAVTNPEQSVSAAKRLIGRKWSSFQAAEARRRMLYKLVEGPHEDIRVELGGQEYSLPEISAMVLSELRLDAEAYFGATVTKAVITVPAYFNDTQRQATKDAGKIAGLDVLRIINEPTAAALAYGFGKQVEKKVVVFDLGGGTLDVSVLDISNGVFDVIATGGDTYLGGEDFDNRIIDWLTEPFEKQHHADLRLDKMALQRLKDAAEKAKSELSSSMSAELNLPFIMTAPTGSLHLQQTLSREHFDALTKDLVERCRDICAQVLQEAGLDVKDIEEVLLVGGQTRTPKVQEVCRQLFNREPSKGVHPEEVVALGAAIQARALSKEAGQAEMLLLDVTPHSLGIMIVGGLFQVLIPKNTTVPTTARHLFTTVKDNQTSARIMVLQGESPQADLNELLGEFMLSGFKQANRGSVEIEVIFDISADGIVSVSARDTDTGLRQSITVTATSGLTEDEVDRMMEQNADYMLAVKNDAQTETSRREVEGLLKEAERLHETVSLSVGSSGLGQDTVRKGEEAMRKARKAIDLRDLPALASSRDALDRTLQLYRSILQRLGKVP